jgi:23S rRNA pseudouridine2605 synthase
MEIRINKYLSLCNIGSRRKIEAMLWNGEFWVNKIKAIPGQMIDTEKDTVTYRGKSLKPISEFTYVALNKPLEVVSTASDEQDRTTVLDIVKIKERLYPVGRLDRNSTGLIILTNDGDLALKLTHPRYHLPKTYEVATEERIRNDQLEKLATGIRIRGVKTLPAEVERTGPKSFRIILHQGMKRQIREMCSEVNLTVSTLHRTKIGNVELENLAPGEYRLLSDKEVEGLKNL